MINYAYLYIILAIAAISFISIMVIAIRDINRKLNEDIALANLKKSMDEGCQVCKAIRENNYVDHSAHTCYEFSRLRDELYAEVERLEEQKITT